MLIQVVLIAIFGLMTLYYFVKLRSAMSDRLIVILSFAVVFTFVLRPQWTDNIAAFLGVESGRFLLLYFVTVFYLYLIMLVWTHVRRNERNMTLLVRQIAILNARNPDAMAPDTRPR